MHRRSACQGSAGSVKCNVLYIVVVVASKWTECFVMEEINPEDSCDDLTDPGSVLKKPRRPQVKYGSKVLRVCDGCSHVWRTKSSPRISFLPSSLTQTLPLDWKGWIKLWCPLPHHSNATLVSALQKCKRYSISSNLNVIRLLPNTKKKRQAFLFKCFRQDIKCFWMKNRTKPKTSLEINSVLLYSLSDYTN